MHLLAFEGEGVAQKWMIMLAANQSPYITQGSFHDHKVGGITGAPAAAFFVSRKQLAPVSL